MKKCITIQVTEVFDRRIRIAAALADCGRSEFIRTAIEERLTQLRAVSSDSASAEQQQHDERAPFSITTNVVKH